MVVDSPPYKHSLWKEVCLLYGPPPCKLMVLSAKEGWLLTGVSGSISECSKRGLVPVRLALAALHMLVRVCSHEFEHALAVAVQIGPFFVGFVPPYSLSPHRFFPTFGAPALC